MEQPILKTMETQADNGTGQAPPTKLEHLTEQLTTHLETRWEYATLGFTEKMSEVVASLASLLAASLFGLMLFLFLSLGFALWLGDVLGNRAGGFALASLMFIPMGIASYIYIRPFVREKIIQTVLKDDDDLPNES